MKINFIGTSDGYPEADRFCSCSVVTVNGKHYVIDAGISLYSMMLRNGYNPEDCRAVFITHMHGDHASGLAEYVDLMMWGSRYKITSEIFVPTRLGKYTTLAYSAAMDGGKDVEMKVYKEGVVYEDENVRVTAYRTQHTDASFGFLVEGEGKRVYFTGDMKSDISDMPEFVYEEKTNLVICESAHNYLPDHADEFNAMKTDRIIINHISSKHSVSDYNIAKPLVTTKPFDIADDGMIAEV